MRQVQVSEFTIFSDGEDDFQDPDNGSLKSNLDQPVSQIDGTQPTSLQQSTSPFDKASLSGSAIQLSNQGGDISKDPTGPEKASITKKSGRKSVAKQGFRITGIETVNAGSNTNNEDADNDYDKLTDETDAFIGLLEKEQAAVESTTRQEKQQQRLESNYAELHRIITTDLANTQESSKVSGSLQSSTNVSTSQDKKRKPSLTSVLLNTHISDSQNPLPQADTHSQNLDKDKNKGNKNIKPLPERFSRATRNDSDFLQLDSPELLVDPFENKDISNDINQIQTQNSNQTESQQPLIKFAVPKSIPEFRRLPDHYGSLYGSPTPMQRPKSKSSAAQNVKSSNKTAPPASSPLSLFTDFLLPGSASSKTTNKTVRKTNRRPTKRDNVSDDELSAEIWMSTPQSAKQKAKDKGSQESKQGQDAQNKESSNSNSNSAKRKRNGSIQSQFSSNQITENENGQAKRLKSNDHMDIDETSLQNQRHRDMSGSETETEMPQEQDQVEEVQPQEEEEEGKEQYNIQPRRKPRTRKVNPRAPRMEITVYKLPKASGGTSQVNAIDMILQTTEDLFREACSQGSLTTANDAASEFDETDNEIESQKSKRKRNGILINNVFLENETSTQTELPPSKGFDFARIQKDPYGNSSSTNSKKRSKSKTQEPPQKPGFIYERIKQMCKTGSDNPEGTRTSEDTQTDSLLYSAILHWRSQIRTRLLSLSDTLDNNQMLETKARKTKTERDKLRNELLAVRQKRIRLEQQIEQEKANFLIAQKKLDSARKVDRFLTKVDHPLGPRNENARTDKRKQKTSSLLVQMESAINKMEWLGSIVGDEGNAVEKLENFNARLSEIDKNYDFY